MADYNLEEEFSAQVKNTSITGRLLKFYQSNKKIVYIVFLSLIIITGSFFYYLENKENEKVSLSDKYIKAKMYINNNDKKAADKILKEVIFANDSTYSVLSLFLIIEEKTEPDEKEISKLFKHLIDNNNFDKETKNLITLKQAIHDSNFLKESDFLMIIKPIIGSDSIWKPHALMLAGDYFFNKNENLKAKDFYSQILSLKDISQEIYNQSKTKLESISND